MRPPWILSLCLAFPAPALANDIENQPTPAPDPGGHAGRDLGSEVLEVFAAKCADCHGGHLPRPKGKFGYVLDLEKLAANPDMVVPFQPAESNLWAVVRDGDMPPEKAKSGPLTGEQKEVIRAWIEAGARPARPRPAPVVSPPVPPTREDVAAEPPGRPLPARVLALLGKLHVAAVHFPIALLLAAAAGELWFLTRRAPGPAPAVRFCVLVGAAGAVLAAGLGWLLAWTGSGLSAPAVLALHRWLGTAAAVVAVATAVLSEADARAGVRSHRFRVLLFLGALLVGAAGHLGGTLVHGEDYFTW